MVVGIVGLVVSSRWIHVLVLLVARWGLIGDLIRVEFSGYHDGSILLHSGYLFANLS